MFRLPETFALTPPTHPLTSGLSSLAYPPPICIPASMCSASRAGETSARATQEHAREAAKRVSDSFSLSLIKARQFHVKPASRDRWDETGSRHAPGLPVSPLRSEPASVVLAALALLRRRRSRRPWGCRIPRSGDDPPPFPTHMFHVKHERMIIPVRHHFAPQT